MLANGTTLGYRKHTGGEASGAYTDLPGLKEIPEVGTEIEKVDNTCLTDPHKMYEQGIGDLPDIIQHGLHVLIGVPPHVLKRIDVDESLKIQMGFGIGIHHARTCPDILLQGVAHHQIQNGEDRYRSDQDSQRDRQDDFLFGAIPVCFSEQSHPPSPKKALISAGRLGICFNNGGNHFKTYGRKRDSTGKA